MDRPTRSVTAALAGVWIGALVLANLSVAYFGPAIAPLNAFLLIGLDLTLRDALHERLTRTALLALIVAAGLLSWLLNPVAGQIAIASAVAFVAASLADTAAYIAAAGLPRFQRVNVSNVAGSAVDSIVFPWLAFGVLDPWLALALFGAKVAGGFLWALAFRALPFRRYPV